MSTAATADGKTLAQQVRAAVAWRSGSQLAAQLVAWGTTFLVIRLLDPSDYGLFALTQTVLVLLNLMNGYGIANALIRQEQVTRRDLRQALGILVLLNGGLALVQFLAAPLVANFYGQPQVIDLLRVQSLLYLATPFLALPYAILSRAMDFRRQAQVRVLASLAGAGTALACALSGWGIWTLVAAPWRSFMSRRSG
ncbi:MULTISPECIES: oligosaccharide flippase family protein [unclassified Sphingomonas]|uniref:oligosaccharide flippase family protein n=1 Tax=unclassified Sphingomonas TaxID=196159 RepID=UPI0027E29EA1|nr:MULTISPECIES: oligosaccharide flippase family protein [unclassified Sphingomonas]